MSKTRVSTTAPWFIPGGQILGIRQDLLEVLRAMDGQSPREIFAGREKPVADLDEPMEPKPWGGDGEMEQSGSVAIVPLIGPVTQYKGVCDWMFGGTSLERFMCRMEEAHADPSVPATVILMDSPGGEVAGIADAADRIREMSKTKPVVACFTADGCSAAYWLASAATKLVASQTAVLGSIGVVMTYIDDSKAEEMAGIRRIEFVSSVSPKKRPDLKTASGKEQIQAVVDEYGQIMADAIAGFRGVSVEAAVTDFGQGGVLIGASAVSAGLADQIGTLEDAILLAQELALAASNSSTGAIPFTARANAEHGGLMAEKQTADQIRAAHPEAVTEISAAAAVAERTRIAGILKLNTTANRAVAAKEIDAAIADGKSTTGDLAVAILEAHEGRKTFHAEARKADAAEVVVEDPATPPEAVPDAKATVKINADAVYDRLNGRAK